MLFILFYDSLLLHYCGIALYLQCQIEIIKKNVVFIVSNLQALISCWYEKLLYFL